MNPLNLKSGDTIGIVATARWMEPSELESAMALIQSAGFKTVVADNVYEKHGQLAGNDDFRTQCTNALIHNHDVKALLVARGGYGTLRIIDRLDLETIAERGIWVCGYSDVTVLHNALSRRGMSSIHSTMPIQMQSVDMNFDTWEACLRGKPDPISWSSAMPWSGEIQAPIVGGNLSVIYSQLGSRDQLDGEGCILFLEDIDEMTYHLDRMIQALWRAGVFKGIRAILLGGMTDMRDNTQAFGFKTDNPWGKSPEEMIDPLAKALGVPLITGFPAGHQSTNLAFYMQKTATLKGSGFSFELSYD